MDRGTFNVMESASASAIGLTGAYPDRGDISSEHWQCVDVVALCQAATQDRETSPHLSAFASKRISAGFWDIATVFELALGQLSRVRDVLSVARTCTWLHRVVRPRLIPLHHTNVAISRAVAIVQRERSRLMLESVSKCDYFPKAAYIATCAPSILHAINTIPLCPRDWRPWLLCSLVVRVSGVGSSIIDVESRYEHLLRLKWYSAAQPGTDPTGVACVAAWKTCYSETLSWCRSLDDDAARHKARCDLFVAELYAPAISVVDRPDKVIKKVAACLGELSPYYRPVVIDAALSICPDSEAIYGRLLGIGIPGEGALPPMSTRALAEMAVLMMCVANVRDVRGHFISHYGLDERYIVTQIEPYMAMILVQEALCPIRIRPVIVLRDAGPDTFPTTSMMCVDQWSILDTGLISCLHTAFVNGVARRAILPMSEWRTLSEERKEVVRETVFCMPASAVSDLAFDLHRFWTIYEEIQNADDDLDYLEMWMEIKGMPWQVQPTMVAHLLAVHAAVGSANGLQDKLLQPAVLAWAAKIVPQCLAAGHPRLAGRAAASVLKLIPAAMGEGASFERMIGRELLRFVLDLSRSIPLSASTELMNGIAGVLSSYDDSTLPEGFFTKALDSRVQAFISDKSVSLLYPSSQLTLFLIARSIHDWRALPESGMPTGAALGAYFRRFHVYNDKAQNVFTNLLRLNIAQHIVTGEVTLSDPAVRAWFGQKEAKKHLLNDVVLLRAALHDIGQNGFGANAGRGRSRHRTRHD